jgi:hypothetical protein
MALRSRSAFLKKAQQSAVNYLKMDVKGVMNGCKETRAKDLKQELAQDVWVASLRSLSPDK